MEEQRKKQYIDLPNLKIIDIFPTRTINWVEKSTSLETALQVMKDLKILSVPVIDLDANTVIGIVDVLDIATFIVASYPSVDQIQFENATSLHFRGQTIVQDVNVSQVMAFSKYMKYSNLPFFPVFLFTPLEHLIASFSRGIHRIPVVDTNNKILNFISQSDVVRHFAENMYLLDNGNSTLEGLGIICRTVHYVREDAPVVLALSIIAAKRVSAVPVLDMSGKLVGNFSASELRGIGGADYPNLLRPIREYLKVYNFKSLFPITCTPGDTLEQITFKLVATKVHRAWVVDNDKRLLGVVSVTDVMRAFLGLKPMEIENLQYAPPTPPDQRNRSILIPIS